MVLTSEKFDQALYTMTFTAFYDNVVNSLLFIIIIHCFL